GELVSERVGRPQHFGERFRGRFDDSQWVPQLVGQPGRKLTQGREPLRPSRFGLDLLQAPVALRECFCQRAVAGSLATAYAQQPVDDDGGEEKEENADGEFGRSTRRQLVLADRGKKKRNER